MRTRWIVLIITLTAAGCGSSSNGATTGPSPNIPNVAGIWRGTSRVLSISGGECIGAGLQGFVGTTQDLTLTIQQTGANLTATETYLSDGSNCSFTGTASNNAVSLTGTFCSAANLTGARCSNGAVRNVTLQSDAITGTVSGNHMTAEESYSSNVTTTLGAGVGVMSERDSLDLTR